MKGIGNKRSFESVSKPRNQMSTNISLSVYHQNHEIKCQQTSHYLFIIKTTKSNVNKHLTICLSTKINLIPAEINETTCILKKNIFLILYLHGISSLSYGDGKYIKKITMFHAWLRNNYDILLTKIYFV